MASTHKAVEKALDILMAFTPHNQEMGTVEVSHKMGFHNSTVSRLLHVLARKGFLQQNPDNKKYHLGPSSMYVGSAIRKSLETNLVHITKPYMDELRDEIQETIALEIFSGANTILAYLSMGPHRTNLAGNIGDILAVNAAAGAKAILAFSSAQVRDRTLNGQMPRLTPNTIIDPALIRGQLESIRRVGVSFDREEHDVGTHAMGTPIFNSEGKPVAALVVVGPCRRIKLESNSPLALRLKEAASKISSRLYYRSPDGEI